MSIARLAKAAARLVKEALDPLKMPSGGGAMKMPSGGSDFKPAPSAIGSYKTPYGQSVPSMVAQPDATAQANMANAAAARRAASTATPPQWGKVDNSDFMSMTPKVRPEDGFVPQTAAGRAAMRNRALQRDPRFQSAISQNQAAARGEGNGVTLHIGGPRKPRPQPSYTAAPTPQPAPPQQAPPPVQAPPVQAPVAKAPPAAPPPAAPTSHEQWSNIYDAWRKSTAPTPSGNQMAAITPQAPKPAPAPSAPQRSNMFQMQTPTPQPPKPGLTQSHHALPGMLQNQNPAPAAPSNSFYAETPKPSPAPGTPSSSFYAETPKPVPAMTTELASDQPNHEQWSDIYKSWSANPSAAPSSVLNMIR